MQVLAAGTFSLKISRAIVSQHRFIGWTKIRRPSQEPWDIPGQNVQHLARGFAACNALRVGGKDREVAIPTGGKFAALHLVNFGREFREFHSIAGEERLPIFPGLRSAPADPGFEMIINTFGDEEFCVLRPAVATLRKADLLLA